METIRSLASACRYCRYYKPEGRRGGVCHQLGAPVQGKWTACSLAVPPFAPSWEGLEDVWQMSETTKAFSPNLDKVTAEDIGANSISIYEQTKSTTVKI